MRPKSIKNHQKNNIKKDMKKPYARPVCQVGPWCPVNLPKINKTHANTCNKTTKKEDNLKEVYLKKANTLLRR